MMRLGIAIMALLAAAVVGCRSELSNSTNQATAASKGASREFYLASNGDLSDRLIVEQGHTGGHKSVTNYVTVEANGKWKSATLVQSDSEQKYQEDGSGNLAKDQIAQLAKVLATNNLATLPSEQQDPVNQAFIVIRFGEIKHHLYYDGQNKNLVHERYVAIAEGVRKIIDKNQGKK